MNTINMFKEGDKVKVLRKAEKEEELTEDWYNVWIESMNSYIGKICIVREICGNRGIRLEDAIDKKTISYCFPPNVLELVSIDTVIANATVKIISCAIIDDKGIIYSLPKPNRHHNILNTHKGLAGCMQGFLGNDGNFYTRERAREIAIEANQIIHRCGGDEVRLYSENLW